MPIHWSSRKIGAHNSSVRRSRLKAEGAYDFLMTPFALQDIFGIYVFAFIICFLMYIPTVKVKPKVDSLRTTAFFRFLNVIVMSMPVGVPAVMIFSIVVALQRLSWRGISVLYPGQLKLAANVDIACFDKTGTLTGSEVTPCSTPGWCMV